PLLGRCLRRITLRLWDTGCSHSDLPAFVAPRDLKRKSLTCQGAAELAPEYLRVGSRLLVHGGNDGAHVQPGLGEGLGRIDRLDAHAALGRLHFDRFTGWIEELDEVEELGLPFPQFRRLAEGFVLAEVETP